MDIDKIVQIGEVKWKNITCFRKQKKQKNGKGVQANEFTPFSMKPLNKIWCNLLPSEVTSFIK